jgi:hypothetical protein
MMGEELKEFGSVGVLTLRRMAEAAEMEPHEAEREFARLRADIECLAQANISCEVLLLLCHDLATMSVLARRANEGGTAGLFDEFLKGLD